MSNSLQPHESQHRDLVPRQHRIEQVQVAKAMVPTQHQWPVLPSICFIPHLSAAPPGLTLLKVL